MIVRTKWRGKRWCNLKRRFTSIRIFASPFVGRKPKDQSLESVYQEKIRIEIKRREGHHTYKPSWSVKPYWYNEWREKGPARKMQASGYWTSEFPGEIPGYAITKVRRSLYRHSHAKPRRHSVCGIYIYVKIYIYTFIHTYSVRYHEWMQLKPATKFPAYRSITPSTNQSSAANNNSPSCSVSRQCEKGQTALLDRKYKATTIDDINEITWKGSQ